MYNVTLNIGSITDRGGMMVYVYSHPQNIGLYRPSGVATLCTARGTR